MSEKQDIKKDLFVQLSFTMYGSLICYNKSHQILVKSAAFTTNPEGILYLIIHQAQEIADIDTTKKVIFSLIKDGSSVVSMHEIKFKGVFEHITQDNIKERKQAQEYFEKKSPFLSTIPFIQGDDSQSELMIAKITPDVIYYQSIKDGREGLDPYVLTLS